MLNAIRRLLGEIEGDREWRQFKRQIFRDALRYVETIVPLLLTDVTPKVSTSPTTATPTVVSPPPRLTLAEIRAAFESYERETYVPSPPARETLADGSIVYEAHSMKVTMPGETEQILVGVESFDKETGWPGLPETSQRYFGVLERFKPKRISLSSGFGLCGCFIGAASIFPAAPGSDFVIPGEALAPGKPQPDYPIAPKGIAIVVIVKNTSNRQQPARVRIVGVEAVAAKTTSASDLLGGELS